jgi:hypothetical protein
MLPLLRNCVLHRRQPTTTIKNTQSTELAVGSAWIRHTALLVGYLNLSDVHNPLYLRTG